MSFLTFRDYVEQQAAVARPEPPKLLPPQFKYKAKRVAAQLSDVPGGKVKGGVFRPKRTLGIPRKQMPQVKSREEFVEWLGKNGVGVSIVRVTPRSLIRANGSKRLGHAQSKIYLTKAAGFIRKNTLLDKLIILSRDGIIFDGNHHWLALMAVAPDTPVPMYRADLTFHDLLDIADEFPGVSYEETVSGELGVTGWGLVFEAGEAPASE